MVNSFTQKYDSPLSPKKINKDLAEEANSFVQDENLFNRFLCPRDMTGIANTLVREGVFENIRGKKEIESRFRMSRRGCRKRGFELRTGGRPSVNKFTQRFETIIRVMTKQEACDLLREKLLRLRLTYEFERFNIMAFSYLMKMDAGAMEKLLRLIAPRYNVLLDKSRQSLRSIIHSFDSFDDKQIEAFADDPSIE